MLELTSEPAAIQFILPIDVAELVKAIFYGVGALCVPLGTVYLMIISARAKRTEEISLANNKDIKEVKLSVAEATTKIDGMLVDRDKAKVEEGEAKEKKAGLAASEQRAEGLAEGIEIATRLSRGGASETPALVAGDGSPLPVKDDRTGTATEDSAAALGRMADAAEKKPD